jgi:hypothetical protein
MPIYIDLLAEDHEADELRRKDPVKRTIFFAGVIVFIVALYCGSLIMKNASLNGTTREKLDKWTALEADFNTVTESLIKTADLERSLTALYAYSNDRFVWGTVLDDLQNNATPGIVITQIRTEQSFTLNAEEKRGKATIPASSTEAIKLWIDAKDNSQNPGSQVNAYREALAALPHFAEHIEPVKGIRLTDLTAPQTDQTSNETFVAFTIECTYPPRERNQMQ